MAVSVPTPVTAVLVPSRLTALLATAAIAVAACASGGPTAAPPSAGSSAPAPTSSAATAPSAGDTASPEAASPSPDATQGASLLLEVRHAGGFINPAATIGAPSDVVVDTDGRIYTPHASPDGSMPMIPMIDVRDTGATGAAAVLGAAHDAGLDTGGMVGLVGDAGSTVFTLVTSDGTEVMTRVGMTGPGGPGAPGGPAGASAAPGVAALALLARLTDATAPWPSSAPARAFEPAAYEVWVAPETPGGVGTATVTWPLTTDPNAFGAPAPSGLGVAGLRSGKVTGAEATTLATALGSMTAGSDLAYQGHAYRVWVRPMLPDELGG